MENPLMILSESLDKKLQVLQEIQEYNQKQEQSFLGETMDLEGFDAAVEEKGRLIERVNQLDEGFELLYERLADELNRNREKYRTQIRELQEKVRRVTDLSVSIQAQEQRNKKLVEQYFAREREHIRQERRNSKAAYDYYRRMSGASYTEPMHLDSRN